MAIRIKTFTTYQRNACKSMIDDLGRAQYGERDSCQKKKNTLCSTRPARHASRALVKKHFKDQAVEFPLALTLLDFEIAFNDLWILSLLILYVVAG